MKKITSSNPEANISFRVNGDELLHLTSTPVVISDMDAAVVLDRLGSQVSVSDATEEDMAAYVESLNPGKAAADAQAKADADAAAAAQAQADADAQAKADADAKAAADAKLAGDGDAPAPVV